MFHDVTYKLDETKKTEGGVSFKMRGCHTFNGYFFLSLPLVNQWEAVFVKQAGYTGTIKYSVVIIGVLFC